MNASAVIVAAGAGARLGSPQPKQFLPLCGKAMYLWSLDALAAHPDISQIVIVVPDDFDRKRADPRAMYVNGGATRADSVLAGLDTLEGDDDQPVLIHDAARPGLTSDIISELLAAIQAHDAAAPALKVVDALKRKTDQIKTLPRETLYRVQTPQIFRLGTIRKALKTSRARFRDELEVMETSGHNIAFTTGYQRLLKVTYEEDFSIMSRILGPETRSIRIGNGYDVHPCTSGDHVILCGTRLEHEFGLAGHSDADVAWHALTDAILGALALGDIGDHFPPTEAQWKNVSSDIFLRRAAELARKQGYALENADITLICERPKIAPYRDRMRKRTANVLGVQSEQISLKATTTEGLGFTGRNEGIAAQAVVTLRLDM